LLLHIGLIPNCGTGTLEPGGRDEMPDL
jgi:hypothetical protein